MTDQPVSQLPREARPKIVIERTYRSTVEAMWELWTSKDGFESWWGPQGFRADVHTIEAREGGTLYYDMVADTPEMIAAMKEMGAPPSHPTHSKFSEFRPHERLAISSVIDFIPGVAPYESRFSVDFIPKGELVKMIVTLEPMHDDQTSQMQFEGFTSQLTKLDTRFNLVTE